MCKDLKGLFTPCPKGLNKAAALRLEESSQAHRHAGLGGEESHHVHASRAAEPAVANTGKRAQPKLCRDLKGLFTPCAR